MRLFVAIEPPAALRAVLRHHAEQLPGRLRRVPEHQLHLTLRFLGEVAEHRVPALVETLAAAIGGPPIPLVLRGGGAFPSAARARVLWAGLEGRLDRLVALAEAVDRAAAAVGLPPADHPFRPHPTLARVRDRLPRETADAVAALPEIGGWTVDEVRLVRSTLGAGVVHEVIATFALGPGDDPAER